VQLKQLVLVYLQTFKAEPTWLCGFLRVVYTIEKYKFFFTHIFSNSSLKQICTLSETSSLSEPSSACLGPTGPMYLILEVSQELRVAGLCSHAKSVRCDELFTDMYLFVQCRVTTLNQ